MYFSDGQQYGTFKKKMLAWELSAQLTMLLVDKKIYLFNSVVLYRLSIPLLPHLKDRWQRFLPFYSLSTLPLASFLVHFSVFQIIPLVNSLGRFQSYCSPVQKVLTYAYHEILFFVYLWQFQQKENSSRYIHRQENHIYCQIPTK